nr:MAG TPA: tail protein [Caudoviricetes sp.]
MSTNLKQYMNPDNVKGSLMDKIIESEKKQLDLLKENAKINLNENFIRKANKIGLTLLEMEFKLIPDNTLSIEERRERLIAHKRGQGTTTIEMIKNVALAFSCGEIDVIEHSTELYVTIKFISIKGIPSNLNNFKDSIRKIMPAHLGIKYEFTYNILNDLLLFSINDLTKYTLDELLNKKLS